MKKKNLKSLRLNKKSISNFENVSGGRFTTFTLLTDADGICCNIQVTGPCDTSQVSQDCLPTEFPCI